VGPVVLVNSWTIFLQQFTAMDQATNVAGYVHALDAFGEEKPSERKGVGVFSLSSPRIFSAMLSATNSTRDYAERKSEITQAASLRSGESQRFIVSHQDERGDGDHWKN